MNINKETRDKIAELFPEYLPFLEQPDVFGPEVTELLIRAAKQKFTSARLLAEFKQTPYYKYTQEQIRNWNALPEGDRKAQAETKYAEILEAYGEVFPDEAEGRRIATEAAKRRLSGVQLRQFVFAESLRTGGAATNKLRLSEEAIELRNNVSVYGYPVTDEEINAALTGGTYNGMPINSQVLINKAKAAAKGTYAHLSNQIDAGLTLDDIFSNYKNYAVRVLGLDPNQVDYRTDPRWAEAFGTEKTGQMSLNDWVYKLKSDDRFGYQFTDEAKQKATSLTMELEKAFGFRR